VPRAELMANIWMRLRRQLRNQEDEPAEEV
jgi:hypothetical protein